MSVSKELVARAMQRVETPAGVVDLVAGGVFVWASACDGFVSVKLNAEGREGEAGAGERRVLSEGVERAIRRVAGSEGAVLRSLIVQFVNHAGVVVEARKFEGEGESGQGVGGGAPGTGSKAVPPERLAAGAAAPGGGEGHAPIPGLAPGSGLSGVGHVIAVGAGKGGVGKSTVAVNLAVGLARRGQAVGLVDGDIYGPSLPTMLGLGALEQAVVAGRLQPFAVHGIKAVTIGKMVEPEKPLIWRGPMAHGAFKQLTERTNWGELDTLIVDLPPGTGDVSLTLAQTLRCTGAVVVCTPQRVAQDDAVRAARMFQQLGIEVLGVVENMSYFVGDDGKEYDIFGRGGAEVMAQRLGVAFLGAIPITMSLRENSDSGDPSANFEGAARCGKRPKSDELLARSLEEMVTNVVGQVSLAALRQGTGGPSLKIS